MPQYERKDHFYKKAKAHGKASRAAYKIEEIQRRFRIIQSGDRVADLGCAPGGWLQPMAAWVGPTGKVVGIDLEKIRIPLPAHVVCVQMDISQCIENPTALTTFLGGSAHAVVSDMAPHTSGTRFLDQIRAVELAKTAWECAQMILLPGGHFVVKIFEGPEVSDFRKVLQHHFEQVKTIDPEASRKGSLERYFVCLSLKKDRPPHP